MIDIRELLKCGVHFGHKTSRWSPQMKPFIWGAKNKIHLIDVSKTAFLLERAGKFLKEASSNGGVILWVGTKKAAQDVVKKIGTSLDMPFVLHRWIGGTLSNFDQIKKAMTRLLYLKDIASKASAHHTKKEISVINKEIERLEKNVGSILNLTYPPAALVVVDAKKEHAAIREALRLNIPVVAIVDTNTDPSGINFVIPANDDAPRSIEVILNYLSAQVEDGKQIYADKSAAELAHAAEEKAKGKKAAIKVEDTMTAVAEEALKLAEEMQAEIDAEELEAKKSQTTKTSRTKPGVGRKKTTLDEE